MLQAVGTLFPQEEHHKHPLTPGESKEQKMLSLFAKKLRIAPEDACRIVDAVDEWWHVPRSDDALRDMRKRREKAYLEYRVSGALPNWCHDAYRYAMSDSSKETEELISTLQKERERRR